MSLASSQLRVDRYYPTPSRISSWSIHPSSVQSFSPVSSPFVPDVAFSRMDVRNDAIRGRTGP
jgi:hypothetical protein